LQILRAYVGYFMDVNDPKWRLMDTMIEYIDFQASIKQGTLPVAFTLQKSLDLDRKYAALPLEAPIAGKSKTTLVEHSSSRIYSAKYDTYGDRHIAQTWNVLRLIRILLNDFILGHQLRPNINMSAARQNIESLGKQICASVPQYTDCLSAARARMPDNTTIQNHTHSPNQSYDCYTLIFPLYVLARSIYCPMDMRMWIIKELRHIGSHFSIRNAELVAQMLGNGKDVTNLWAVYAMLGGYAFAA